jgi:tRNA(fMet)-specific endonuclease VapC
MFLLDTDHISILQWQSQPEFGRLTQRMKQHPAAVFHFCIVSFHEQVLGANAYIGRAHTTADVTDGYELLERIRADFAAVPVLPFDQAAAVQFDNLRAQRVRIGTMDLRIAAIALARDMTLLTRNLRDFAQAPRLRVEDWTS